MNHRDSGLRECPQIPSLQSLYLRALLHRKSGKNLTKGQTLDAVACLSTDVCARRLGAYQSFLGIPKNPILPLLYPQVLAAGLPGEIFLQPGFPHHAISLVHVGQKVTYRQTLTQDHRLSVVTRWAGEREVPKGVEIDILTEVRNSDAPMSSEAPWESLMTLLVRKKRIADKKRDGSHKSVMAERLPAMDKVLSEWFWAANLGRRYASISGDYNPIHLYSWSARLFGFRRQIAHGLFSLAKAASVLTPTHYPIVVEASFKKPVLLPAKVRLHQQGEGFELRSGTIGKPSSERGGEQQHIVGTVR